MTFMRAGGPDPTVPRPSITTSSALTKAGSALTLSLDGRQAIAVSFDDQTALSGLIGFRVLNSKGTFENRTFWDGNKWTPLCLFPNGTGSSEQGVTFSAFAHPGDTDACFYVNTYTSGSVNCQVTAYDALDPIVYQLSLGIDGGNPSGATSESPGSLSIGGKDATTPRIHRTASYDSGGRACVRPWGPIDWATGSLPAVNVVASASRAAGGAGVRNICTSITATLISSSTVANAATTGTVVLRDGPTANGAILWAAQMALPATAGSAAAPINLGGLNIRGSANTTMCLEFLSASGASTQQCVSITGVSLVDG